MPYTVSYANIVDFEVNFPNVVQDGIVCLNPVLETFAYICRFTMMNELTEKNADEFYLRYKMWAKVEGPISYHMDENGKEVDNITPDIIKKMIGFHSNIMQESHAAFRKFMSEVLENHIHDDIRREARNAKNNLS